ncbi:MAG: DNA alkylation repair protein, partial [Firmicutes bacterium]|nr:DNA alkylation repair protein [Bacillota bacterium]
SLFMPLIEKCLESEREYDLRFALVMLLDHYIADEYIDYVLDIYEKVKSEYYYVKMAVAWGLSVCFVKYPEKTIKLLEQGSLDAFTHNKTIQKICESLRVSKESKNNLKKLKKKC